MIPGSRPKKMTAQNAQRNQGTPTISVPCGEV